MQYVMHKTHEAKYCIIVIISQLNFLTNVSALLLGPPPKLTSANILLTAPGEQQGILEANANTHIRWKSSYNGTSRHNMDLKRRTLFLTPKRQAVGSNPAGITSKPVLTADLLGERAVFSFRGVVANGKWSDVGNLLTNLLDF